MVLWGDEGWWVIVVVYCVVGRDFGFCGICVLVVGVIGGDWWK